MKHFKITSFLSVLFLSSFCTLEAQLVIIKDEPDLFKQAHCAKNFSLERVSQKLKRMAEIKEQMKYAEYSENAEYKYLETSVTRLDRAIHAIYEVMQKLAAVEPITREMFAMDCPTNLTTLSQKEIEFFKNILPANGVRDELWQIYSNFSRMITNSANQRVPQEGITEPWIAQLLPKLDQAKTKLEALVEDGDTVLGLGNTPQYLIQALAFSTKNLRCIPIAISGQPGGDKIILTDILTEQGLSNFITYIKSLNLGPEGNHKRFIIPDMVGSGGGIEFFIRRLYKMYKEAGIALPQIKIVAINEFKSAKYYDKDTKQFVGSTLKVDAVSLEMPDLADMLDRVPNCFRTTPIFNALSWHQWHVDPTILPVGRYAHLISQAIQEYFIKRSTINDV